MACPVTVVENEIADELIEYLKKFVAEMKLGPAYDPNTGMGPIMNEGHLKFITDWIEKGIEEGLAIMNKSRFANGSVIYTQNGHYAREFAYRTDAVMVGLNVGIPVPLGIFGFTGHKDSFFGDLHVMGKDGFTNVTVLFHYA